LSQRVRVAVTERIVSLAHLGRDPTVVAARLQPLAESIFGAGDRRPDWLARKLFRECVDVDLSRLAIAGDDPDDASAWLGYVLVGTPPSLRPAARTAGTGVVAYARGAGLGRALVESALAGVAARDDLDSLEILAEQGRETFYSRLGFVPVQSLATLLAFGRGEVALQLPPAAPWDDGTPATDVQAFLAEAWSRTPASERGTFELATPHGRVTLHVCREGVALAIHRTRVDAPLECVNTAASAAYDAFLDAIPDGTPALLVGIDRVSSVTRSLDASGWIVVQRATLVRARA
jgi:hypothetical protein